MKRILALILALMMVFALVGCGEDAGTPEGETTTAGTEEGGLSASTIKVGVIHIGDPADGSGYSYAHDQGIVKMAENLGIADSQIVRKLNVSDTDTNATKEAIEDCVAQKCNIIFGTSYGYMEIMDELAKQYPDVIFSHGSGYMSNETNFNNYFGRIYQARYLAGIAAGLKTKSNKLGYVAAFGTELAETSSGINAFAMGARSVNPEAVVYVKTLGSWYDPQNETAYAEALLEMDCDVIAQHCDTPNPQIAAQKAGAFGCGYNSDMTTEAPEAHLCAPIWNWDVYYTAATDAVIKGTWATFGNYYGGYKDGLVDVSPLSKNVAEGTQGYIDQVTSLFNAGSWDVFSGVALSFDESGKLVQTDAALKDNTGKEVVAAGGPSVEDSVITGTMNYFVEGVEAK